MKVSLVTGRTIDQGCSKESGKLSPEYMDYAATCELDPEDMKKLKVREGRNVKVTTKFGSVIVKVKKSRREPHPGVVFIPYGPWSNVIVDPKTHGTGMPSLKGIDAHIEPTKEEVLDLKSLLLKYYGGKSAEEG